MGQTAKTLSRTATQLPLTAISLGLQAWERSRGAREFALRRGNEALQIAAHTPLGRLLPTQIFHDNADEEAAGIAADARQSTAPAADAAPAKPAAPKPAGQTTTAKKPAPKAAPKAATKPDNAAAREVGAPGAVTDQVEHIADKLHVEAAETRDELPIPDFDNISIGSLRARLRSLSVEQLVTLREWEQAHANRLVVVTTLDNRIAKLAGDSAPAHGNGKNNGNGNGNGKNNGNGSTGTGGTASQSAQNDVGPTGTAYPQEAKAAEQAAEDEGGTLRV